MEQQDLSYVKLVINSILTSSPGILTISQILKDYINLEGNYLPYIQLGFTTVYELLESMDDILKVPRNPTIDSYVKLIVSEKTSHLRQLVLNQKSRRTRTSKRCISRNNINFGHSPINKHNFKRDIRNVYENNAPKYNYNVRGYDYIKQKSSNLPESKGIVTYKLQKYIENLCKDSKHLSTSSLKNHLINHPDYNKLNTSNIEDAINMLKYFLYIDRGSIHLKDSPYENFPSNKSKTINNTKVLSSSFLQNIIDEDEAMSYMNDNDLFDDCYDDYDDNNISNNLNSNFKNTDLSETSKENKNPNEMSIVLTDKPIFNHGSVITNNMQSKSEIIEPLNKKQNLKKISTMSTDKPISNNNVKYKIELNRPQINKPSVPLVKDVNYYKNIIASIIRGSRDQITVKQVMEKFKSNHGYIFPFQKLNCRTCMDFFRLHPTSFELTDQYSTNSIITLREQNKLHKLKTTNRHNFIVACIFNDENDVYNDLEQLKLVQSEYNSKSIIKKNNVQPLEDSICVTDTNCEKISNSLEMYDSDMILDSMKEKMRKLLTKYNNGIPSNMFIDIYAKEYNSYFTFSEYGFKSIKDMAYKLPSVFYVKLDERDNECTLYNAEKRVELEINSNDPSKYYKKIPKTILHNLALFFKKNRTGVSFDKLMKLYCIEFGRSYEPLKYGYSSEKHMFESLNKMVEIKNDKLYTLDPFAYTDFIKNEDPIDMKNTSLPLLPVDNFLMNYSGKDVCNGKFVYQNFMINNAKTLNVVIGEIYSSSSFYIQKYSSVDVLNRFMADFQEYYEKNEDYYKVVPELLTIGLACTSQFEDTMQWHRAKILKIVDENRVQLLYVDYGSVEIVQKSNVRLLSTNFSNLPIQSLHCSLYECDQLNNVSRELNEYFADLIENKTLEAIFHKLKTNDINAKKLVTLYFNTNDYERININKEFLNKLKQGQQTKETVRRTILKLDELDESTKFNGIK